jgi:hypothetical protein
MTGRRGVRVAAGRSELLLAWPKVELERKRRAVLLGQEAVRLCERVRVDRLVVGHEQLGVRDLSVRGGRERRGVDRQRCPSSTLAGAQSGCKKREMRQPDAT